jgi:hypothetical protein
MHTIRAGRVPRVLVLPPFDTEPVSYGLLIGRKNPLSSMCASC